MHLFYLNHTNDTKSSRTPEGASTSASTSPGNSSLPLDEAAIALFSSGNGRVVVAGDSNCLDSSHVRKPCFDALDQLLAFALKVGACKGPCFVCGCRFMIAQVDSQTHTKQEMPKFLQFRDVEKLSGCPLVFQNILQEKETLTSEATASKGISARVEKPLRRDDFNFTSVSRVLQNPIRYV